MANIDAIIINDHGQIITKSKEKGELCIAGKQVTQGYWRNDKKTRLHSHQSHITGRQCDSITLEICVIGMLVEI